MKDTSRMRLIRHLVTPWFAFFLLAVTAIVICGTVFHVEASQHPFYRPLLAAGFALCWLVNFMTLGRVGIWMSNSLPLSLRYTSRDWVFRALKVILIAAVVYGIGQISWMPLFWQGIVIPIVFTIALFIAVWSLIGPILKSSENMSFGRLYSMILSLPFLVGIPFTAMFLGQTIVTAYQSSRADLTPLALVGTTTSPSTDAAVAVHPTPTPEPELSAEAQRFRDLAQGGHSCADDTKDVQNALVVTAPEDVAYWAARAVKCTEMKMVVGLPRLVDLMMKHKSPKVRAAAMRAMTKFGTENVKKVTYLLVKRIGENEPEEVIQTAAQVMMNLGEDERKIATTRLKNLLDTPERSTVAAQVLSQTLKRDDVITEYVTEHLTAEPAARDRAIGMICLLPEADRKQAESQIPQIVSRIKTGDQKDPAIQALSCLGEAGFKAIREEVLKPEHLDRPVAARALAEMDVKSAPEALETAATCARDDNPQVRTYCSQTLGRIGAPALPKILDLLHARDEALKEAGRKALNSFHDLSARDELEKIRAENSGWMANNKKLQIAKAVDTALVRLVQETKAQESEAEAKKSE